MLVPLVCAYVCLSECLCVCARSDSLVTLRPLPAARAEAPQQLVPPQEDEGAQSEQRENQEEEDQQSVPH